MRVVERSTDMIACPKPVIPIIETHDAMICILSLFPETKTLVFNHNPQNINDNPDLPVLLNDDPEIFLDKPTKTIPSRGNSSIKVIYNLIFIPQRFNR